MKKLVSLAAAGMLILGMSLNVCAAPSVSKLPTAVATSGESTNVTVRSTSGQYTRNAKINLPAVAQISEEEAETYQAIATFDLQADKNGEIKIYIAGVKESDHVIVLHQCSVHGWEKIEVKAGNGYVIGNFHDYGAVVVFVKGGVSSPKTADSGITAAVAVAGIAMTGLVLNKKKTA